MKLSEKKMQPFQDTEEPIVKVVELFLKFVPLLVASIWMSRNLRYEKIK